LGSAVFARAVVTQEREEVMLDHDETRTEAGTETAGRYVAPPPAAPADQFPETNWTWIRQARGGDRREALGALCKAYWYPVYCFLRRQGARSNEAADITQDFFAYLMATDQLAGVEPREDALFRSWLRTVAKRYFLNHRDREHTKKRGGGAVHIPIDGVAAERKLDRELMHTLTPDRLFDRCWARTVTERAQASLRSRIDDSEDLELLSRIIEELSGDEPPRSRPNAGQTPVPGVERTRKSRRRDKLLGEYRKDLRREIHGTVGSPELVDREIRLLLDVLPCRKTT
jgi:RNA polymerase sigma-70 factor (ECF subfamily)